MASMALNFKSDLRIEIRNLNYPGIHVHVASDDHFGGLWGHHNLQMILEVKANLKIELGDLNYIWSHASLAYKGFLEMIETDSQLSSIDFTRLPPAR